MAFDPIHFFRKYQRLWMAAILLMCMLTFVLCTGAKSGGLDDFLFRLIGRSHHGTIMAKINGVEIYKESFDEISSRRKLADLYMKKYCTFISDTAEKQLKLSAEKAVDPKYQEDVKKRDDFNRELVRIYGARAKNKAPYFGGGYTFEDLVDFKIWLVEADRLRINLPDNAVKELVRVEMEREPAQYVADDAKVMYQLYSHSDRNVALGMVTSALRDEFRVHMAQLAMVSSQPRKYLPQARGNIDLAQRESVVKGVRVAPTPAQWWEFYKKQRAEYTLDIIPIDVKHFLKDEKAPTEAEIQAFFELYRQKPYNPTSDKPGFEIPAKVQVAWVTADPKAMSFKNREGQQIVGPAGLAKLFASMEVCPLPIVDPLLPGYLNLVRYVVGPRAEQVSCEPEFRKETAMLVFRLARQGPPPIKKDILDGFQFKEPQKSPFALVSFIGVLAPPAPAGFAAAELIKPKAPGVRQKTVAIGAGTVGLGVLGAQPLAAVWFDLLYNPRFAQKYPTPKEVASYRDAREHQRAVTMVANIMATMRQDLQRKEIQRDKIAIQRYLDEELKGWPFEYQETKEFYDSYTIDKTPELAALRNSFDKYYAQVNFVEGRSGNDKNPAFKENDFHRLFFENDPYAANEKFLVKAWPPTVTINPVAVSATPEPGKLGADMSEIKVQVDQMARNAAPDQTMPFDLFEKASQPFLFWRCDEKPAEYPPVLEKDPKTKQQRDLRDRVEKAWKVLRLRDGPDGKAFVEAAQIADRLKDKKSVANVKDYADKESKKLGRIGGSIFLSRIAPLFKSTSTDARGNAYGTTYVPYAIDKATAQQFWYPRPDMAKQVLMFANPDAPLKIGDPKKLEDLKKSDRPEDKLEKLNQESLRELDNLNARLFKDYQASVKDQTNNCRLVQVLTNQPRDFYYVAVIAPRLAAPAGKPILVEGPYADREDFLNACKAKPNSDQFLSICFDSLAKDHYDVLMGQLRRNLSVDTEMATAEDRKHFDGGGN